MSVEFTFCRTALAASSTVPWHLRQLTGKGRFLYGGADTKTLCGMRADQDVEVRVSHHALVTACKSCTKELHASGAKIAPPVNHASGGWEKHMHAATTIVKNRRV